MEFGLSLDSFRALRRILQIRPFDRMPGLDHRYFIAGEFGQAQKNTTVNVSFRIEVGRNSKKISEAIPEPLAKNFRWFLGLASFEPAAHLKITDTHGTKLKDAVLPGYLEGNG
jgi:hypothetical protein